MLGSRVLLSMIATVSANGFPELAERQRLVAAYVHVTEPKDSTMPIMHPLFTASSCPRRLGCQCLQSGSWMDNSAARVAVCSLVSICRCSQGTEMLYATCVDGSLRSATRAASLCRCLSVESAALLAALNVSVAPWLLCRRPCPPSKMPARVWCFRPRSATPSVCT